MIVDMDGTLADVSGIRHYILPPTPKPKGWHKDFHAFHSESVNVPAHAHVVDQVHRAHMLGTTIIIVTARRAMYRHATAWWLALHGVPSDLMLMRGDKDGRPDYDVKSDILHRIQQEYDVIHAIDDNPAVLALWAEHGIPTTVVPSWED